MSFFFQLTLVSSVAKRKLLVKWKSLIINFWGLWCELKVIKFYLAFTCVCVCVCVWCNYWKILKCKISLLGTVVISRNDMALFDVLNQWSTVAPLQWVQNAAACSGSCHLVTISVRHWMTYTGCRFAVGSITNYIEKLLTVYLKLYKPKL